jgi:murein DD-endopeptidase MepM/ murein hydrolase activator NlpD|tara:strand:- start:1750 stop:2478 length:729 start_codon:yes stop_codon:yes gene_type:complete
MNKTLFFLIMGNFLFSQTSEQSKNSALYLLSTISKKDTSITQIIVDFKPEWVDSLKLILPCEGVTVPKRSMRLPNAPRDYRNGIHRGIDFFANWGTPVRAVADGIVVRSDTYYKEVPADFRETMLDASAKVGNTPSDIFNSILLGQAIFLDHGFDLIPGFRVITIYAHLSHIKKKIKPGEQIKAGQIIGKSGNTGMRESTLGSKSGSHLHWEMILQRDKEEIYLGRNMSNPELFNMLTRIFN